MDKTEFREYIRTLKREDFLDGESKALAGLDAALSIGHGQTISQPSLVWLMTELLDPEKSSNVLELGTGSGYQTVLLARFSGTVHTMERIPELSHKAEQRLRGMGYQNIRFHTGDGSRGLPEAAPFDRIMVTAAASCIPIELTEQLAPGGRMVIPVGERGIQDLMLLTKDDGGAVHIMPVEKVVFVELKGAYGFREKE
jgi:protein-L-isoaspartate(D-aspartate) O-methyltransferase